MVKKSKIPDRSGGGRRGGEGGSTLTICWTAFATLAMFYNFLIMDIRNRSQEIYYYQSTRHSVLTYSSSKRGELEW